MKKHFYAVRRGRQVGIFHHWSDARLQVEGFPRAEYKGFATAREAEQYMGNTYNNNNNNNAAPTTPTSHQRTVATEIYAPSDTLQFAPSHAPYARQAPSYSSNSSSSRAHPYQRDHSRGYHSSLPSYANSPPKGPSAIEVASMIRSQRAASISPRRSMKKETPAAAASASSSSSSASPPSPTHTRSYGVVFCDGAAKFNGSGPTGCGGLLYRSDRDGNLGTCLTTFKEYLGVGTNNESEYHGLIHGLRTALAHGITDLTLKLDSELVVKQMAGEYQVKAAHLIRLYHQALTLAAKFQTCQVQHVYREANALADQLANEAIEDHQTRR